MVEKAEKKEKRAWRGIGKLKDMLVPIGDLLEDPANARFHPDDNIEAIKRSLKGFSQTKNIVSHLFHGKDTLTVIAGNGTLKAAAALGWTHIAAEQFEGSDDEARAYAIADNATTDKSHWDEQLLLAQLKHLQENSELESINVTGFDESEIDQLEEKLDQKNDSPDESMTDPGPSPLRKSSVSKMGDIWIMGEHRLLIGDARLGSDMKALMQGEEADLAFTDPPYNVSYVGGTKEKLTMENDSMDPVKFRAFLTDAFTQMRDAMKKGAAFYICSPAGPDETVFRLAVQDLFSLRQCIAWVKDHFVLSRQDYHWRHESILYGSRKESVLYGWKDGAAHYFVDDRAQDTVWEIPRPRASREHPTIKPLELVERAVQNGSKKKQIVLDPFAGSGTTIVAAERLGRKARLMEIDPVYADVIVRRWQGLTHETAVNAETNRTFAETEKGNGETKSESSNG